MPKTKKRTDYPPFANASEADCWMSANCDVCIKAEHPIVAHKRLVGYANSGRCKVNKEILDSIVTGGVTKRVNKIINMPVCPFIRTEWDKRKKKDVEPKLFEDEK